MKRSDSTQEARTIQGALPADAYRELLLQISTFFHPDPEVSYRFVADRLSAFYGGATAAITLHQGEQILFKYVANPPEWAKGVCGIPTEDAYCARTLRTNRVTLIQDVRRDREFCQFPTTALGWTRYLGAPIRDNRGRPIGTLCIIDGRHDQPLGDADRELIALLAMRVSAELERERLFEERLAQERRALEERSRQLERTQQALSAIAHALHSANFAKDAGELAQKLTEALTQLQGVRSAAILHVDAVRPRVEGVLTRAGSQSQPLSLPARGWRSLWGQLLASPAPFAPLPAALARALGAVHGLGCLYRDANAPAGIIAFGYDPLPDEDEFRTVYAEPMLHLTAQVLESYALRQRVQQMYETLNRMQQQLIQHEKLSVVGMLAATTAHDIRNIISSLALSLAVSPHEPERLQSELRAQLDRLNVLAYRLLSYARPSQLQLEKVNLPALVQRVLELTRSHLHLTQVKVQQELAPRLPRIEADPTQLELMLVNLVLNALKAMEPTGGGVLTIGACRSADRVRLWVADTGVGIPESVLPNLFEPFACTRPDGFGLGLYSVKRTIDMHGGRIRVSSQPQRGTIFEIELPIRQVRREVSSDAATAHRR